MPTLVTLSGTGTAETSRRTTGLSLGRRFLIHLARQVEHGQLLIRMPSGEAIHTTGPHPGPSGTLVLHRWRGVRRLLMGGDIGFAKSYMDGDWSTPNLTSLIQLAARNRETLMPSLDGSRIARFVNRLVHLRRINTRRGSRRNIPAHYDLGNDFYAAWLDPGMTYSSALYDGAETTLEKAQTAKQDLVMAALTLTGGERVLEMGCGWGGLADRLARERGSHVVGLTLSPAQLDFARARLAAPSPGGDRAAGSVELYRRDYRDADGTFDRVVSIEMLEAVGREYWPTYFASVRDRLRPGGIAVLQVITMAEDRYAAYERGADFIQRHIFPGGMLPSDSAMRGQIDEVGLVLDGVRIFGLSYARTLADWQARFQRAWPRLRTMGFDERFKRKWQYYSVILRGRISGWRAGRRPVSPAPADNGYPAPGIGRRNRAGRRHVGSRLGGVAGRALRGMAQWHQHRATHHDIPSGRRCVDGDRSGEYRGPTGSHRVIPIRALGLGRHGGTVSRSCWTARPTTTASHSRFTPCAPGIRWPWTRRMPHVRCCQRRPFH